jgi:hypothetical protein
MLKVMQILVHMMQRNYSDDMILDELHEIVDNGRSNMFVLSDKDIAGITAVFYDDDKFNSAWISAELECQALGE